MNRVSVIRKCFGFTPSVASLNDFAERYLREPQKSRFLNRFVCGMSIPQIAKLEAVSISTISKSLAASVEAFCYVAKAQCFDD